MFWILKNGRNQVEMWFLKLLRRDEAVRHDEDTFISKKHRDYTEGALGSSRQSKDGVEAYKYMFFLRLMESRLGVRIPSLGFLLSCS